MLASSEIPPLIGESPAFLEVMDRVSALAPVDRPVLVVGERGTGKELVAARLHYLSARWDRPYVQVNAAALPEALLESELFGHEQGAFTGALRQRRGRFELADGGTLFLDEIADAPHAVQEKLLRVVEYGTLERLGGQSTIRVDVRVIGATNKDLVLEADSGRFRWDLLDRLAFEVLTLPPLRARPEDIPVLAGHFGRAMAAELGWDSFPGFGEQAMAALHAHGWPGNVRELRNAVERSVHLAEPEKPIEQVRIDPFDSPYRRPPERPERPPEPPAAPTPIRLGDAIAALERRLIEEALAARRHNQRAAARTLGLTYDQLRHRLRKHGL
jgi:psp operon transcriptional activator